MESNLIPIAGVPPGSLCIQEGSYSPSGLMEDLCNSLNAINEGLDNPLNFSDIEMQISLGVDLTYIQNLRNFFSGAGVRFPPNLPTKIPPIIIKPLPISKPKKELIEGLQNRLTEVWPDFMEIIGREYTLGSTIPNWNDLAQLLEETEVVRDELERLMNELKSHTIEHLPKNRKDEPNEIILLCEKDPDGNFVYQEQINDSMKKIMKAIKDRLDVNKAEWDKQFKNNRFYDPLIPIPYVGKNEFFGKIREGDKRRGLLGSGPGAVPYLTRPLSREEAPSLWPTDPEDPEFTRPPQLLKPPS